MRPGDRLVCAFVDQVPSGTEFMEWPLHVTVVPWFRTDVSSAELANQIEQALTQVISFEVRIGRESTFGHGKTVNLVETPTPLIEVEQAARTVLKNHQSWLVDETTRKKGLFQPHVTAQKSLRLHEGESFWCDRLYIVEQKGKYKTVSAEVLL